MFQSIPYTKALNAYHLHLGYYIQELIVLRDTLEADGDLTESRQVQEWLNVTLGYMSETEIRLSWLGWPD